MVTQSTAECRWALSTVFLNPVQEPQKISGVGACCVMSAWWSKLKMLPFFTFSTGMPVLYVDTDQHLTQLLCSLYTGVGRSTSEV